MLFKRNHFGKLSFAIILSFFAYFPLNAQSTDLDFFVGTWDFKVWFHRDTTKPADISALWKLEKGLDSVLCLIGNVTMNGKNFTRELITTTPGTQNQYTRTIITNNGDYIQLTSPGWQGEQLTWTGIQLQNGQNIQLKEDIFRISNNRFMASFYKLVEGKWAETQTELLVKLQ